MVTLASISQEIDENGFKRSEKFQSERGAEYSIVANSNGLYSIVDHSGGKLGRSLDGYFTSHSKARKELIAYIDSTDKMGYAVHPDKPKDKIRVGKAEQPNG